MRLKDGAADAKARQLDFLRSSFNIATPPFHHNVQETCVLVIAKDAIRTFRMDVKANGNTCHDITAHLPSIN